MIRSDTTRACAVGAIVTLVGSLVLAVGIERPLILPDESGHILNALQIRGTHGTSGLGYYHGYSALLSPLIDASMGLRTLMFWVHAANAALSMVTFLFLWKLAARLRPDIEPRDRWIAVMVVVAYPAYRLFAALALSENLLVPAVVGVLLLLVRVHEAPTAGRVWQLGVVAGLTASIHPRSIVVPMAVVFTGWICLRKGRSQLTAVTGLVTIAAIVVESRLLTSAGITEVDSASRDTLSGLLRANSSLVGLFTLPLTALGQLFYLTAATFGLVALGVAGLLPLLKRRNQETGAGSDPSRIVATFIVVLCAASLALSALFLNQTTGDQAIYGRYMEGVLAPLLLVGALQFLRPSVSVDRVLRSSLVAMGVVTLVLLLGRGAGTFDGRQQLLNITGVFPVVRAMGRIRLSDLLIFACVGTTAVFLVRRASASLAGYGLLVVFLAITASNVQVARAALDNLTDGVVDLSDETAAAAGVLGVDCVGLDQNQLSDRWHQENLRLDERQLRFEYWDSGTDAEPCSPLVVSANRGLENTGELISAEPTAVASLWVLGDDASAVLASSGFRTIRDPAAPIDPDHQIALTLHVDGELAVKPGERVVGTVLVTNNGERPLMPLGAFSEVIGVVNIGLDWRSTDAAAERRSEPSRIALPKILDPGESVEIPFSVRASDEFGSLEPGSYRLVAESVQEGVRWTGQSDEVPFTVRWKNQGE